MCLFRFSTGSSAPPRTDTRSRVSCDSACLLPILGLTAGYGTTQFHTGGTCRRSLGWPKMWLHVFRRLPDVRRVLRLFHWISNFPDRKEGFYPLLNHLIPS